MDESNYRDERQIKYLDEDECRGHCKSTTAQGAIRRVDGSVVAWCLDSTCRVYLRPFGIAKFRYLGRYWPDEPLPRNRTQRRDSRFVVPFDREEYIYARDSCCAHCGERLSELAATTELLEEWRADRGRYGFAEPITLFELPPAVQRSDTAPRAAMGNRPIRYKRPRALDHILPYWLGLIIAPYLKERAVELIGYVAVVASCPSCNSMRQVPRPSQQLLSPPVINQTIASMQRLFAERILIDPDVDPVTDHYLFTTALSKMRNYLLGQDLGKLTGSNEAAS